MSLAHDYIALVETIDSCIELPAIAEIHVSTAINGNQENGKFAVMVLEGGIVGLTYVNLDNALLDLQTRSERYELIGCSAREVAQLYAGHSGWQRALGMAAINAVSQYVLSRSGYRLAKMNKTVSMLDLKSADRVGMVGYFPPLVEQVRAMNIPLTVIELDPDRLQKEGHFEVTLHPERLSTCNKVLCTATTLINHSLDNILSHCHRAERIDLFGPTAGCLPDPLFARGVTLIGGSQIQDYDTFIELWSTQQRWRESAYRYAIHRDDYPGIEALLSTIDS